MDLSILNRRCGYENKIQINSSGTWTVPDGVNQIDVWATGGGGGGGNSTAADRSGGGGGGAGGTAVSKCLSVEPGDTLTIVIGAGGSAETSGGNTLVFHNNIAVAVGSGGNAGQTATGTQSALGGGGGVAGSITASGYRGGKGGGGRTTGSATADSGFSPEIATVLTGTSGSIVSVISPTLSAASVGGTSSGTIGAGGGGGSSIYGRGGNGGGGTPLLEPEPAPESNYGAGGGGSRGANSSTVRNGAPGAAGLVEIWY